MGMTRGCKMPFRDALSFFFFFYYESDKLRVGIDT